MKKPTSPISLERNQTHGEFGTATGRALPQTSKKYDTPENRKKVEELMGEYSQSPDKVGLTGTLKNAIPLAREIAKSTTVDDRKMVLAKASKQNVLFPVEFILVLTGFAQQYVDAGGMITLWPPAPSVPPELVNALPANAPAGSAIAIAEVQSTPPHQSRVLVDITTALESAGDSNLDEDGFDQAKANLMALLVPAQQNALTAIFANTLTFCLLGILIRARKAETHNAHAVNVPDEVVNTMGSVMEEYGLSQNDSTINRGINEMAKIIMEAHGILDGVPKFSESQKWSEFWKKTMTWRAELIGKFATGRLTETELRRLSRLPGMHRVISSPKGPATPEADTQEIVIRLPKFLVSKPNQDKFLEDLGKLADQQKKSEIRQKLEESRNFLDRALEAIG